MLSDYLRIAFRFLWKNRGLSLINVIGLALGIAITLLSLLFVTNELSYDRFHEHKDRIYRVIVLKKALRNLGNGPLLHREGWAGNVELLELAVHHARRVEEVGVDLRYDIRKRKTRFRPLQTLKALTGIRGRVDWTPEEGTA